MPGSLFIPYGRTFSGSAHNRGPGHSRASCRPRAPRSISNRTSKCIEDSGTAHDKESEDYFNFLGEKTLRSYTVSLNLARFDRQRGFGALYLTSVQAPADWPRVKTWRRTLAAARVGRQVAVVTRLAKADTHILDPLIAAGIDINNTPAEETTYIRVIHPSAAVDLRRLIQVRSAGQFRLEDVPALAAPSVHLAGISDQEFTLEFIAGLKRQGHSLSADMQSFVRQRDPATHEIFFRDVPHKRAILPLLSQVKLDVVEAEVLTGTRNLEHAALTIESWGCPEVVITQADGALAYAQGQMLYESFTNRSVVGRTGRGDTLFGAYLAWRLDHSPAESLKFAAALTSIKIETTGPFQGNLAEVRRRMQRETRISAPLDEDITA